MQQVETILGREYALAIDSKQVVLHHFSPASDFKPGKWPYIEVEAPPLSIFRVIKKKEMIKSIFVSDSDKLYYEQDTPYQKIIGKYLDKLKYWALEGNPLAARIRDTGH
jgi:hypothetical protein